MLVVLALSQLALSLSAPVHNLTQLTIRQRIVPDELLGRVNATMRTLVWSTLPLGFAVGGLLANAAGVTAALIVGAGITAAAVGIVLAVPAARFGGQSTPSPRNGANQITALSPGVRASEPGQAAG